MYSIDFVAKLYNKIYSKHVHTCKEIAYDYSKISCTINRPPKLIVSVLIGEISSY